MLSALPCSRFLSLATATFHSDRWCWGLAAWILLLAGTARPPVRDLGKTCLARRKIFGAKKSHTCIHTPGSLPMEPEELTKANLSSAFDGVDIFYFDVRLHDTACLLQKRQVKEKSLFW